MLLRPGWSALELAIIVESVDSQESEWTDPGRTAGRGNSGAAYAGSAGNGEGWKEEEHERGTGPPLHASACCAGTFRLANAVHATELFFMKTVVANAR